VRGLVLFQGKVVLLEMLLDEIVDVVTDDLALTVADY
jgi:hypothetical protein